MAFSTLILSKETLLDVASYRPISYVSPRSRTESFLLLLLLRHSFFSSSPLPFAVDTPTEESEESEERRTLSFADCVNVS